MPTILIVDDECNLCDLIRDNLQEQGYQVLQAFDGPSALTMAKDALPDLVILDMPPMADREEFVSVEQGNPEIQIAFDQERAAKLGLAVRDIADGVVANVRGEVATRYTWQDDKIDVLVKSVDTRSSSIEDIERLIVNPMAQRPVTLDAVADISVSQGPAEIRRVAQERVAVITAGIAYGDLGSAAAEAQAILDSVPMPAGTAAIFRRW